MCIGKEGVLILGDNESSLKLAKNPVFHQRSKHIRIEYHSVRDRVEKEIVELCKVDTGLNADDEECGNWSFEGVQAFGRNGR